MYTVYSVHNDLKDYRNAADSSNSGTNKNRISGYTARTESAVASPSSNLTQRQWIAEAGEQT